ncbi:hypothetical protein QYE76_037899 [Lolium multiflorum]|uniref:Retrotransposon gag domain-containing protein n=1 Tax=Lolium multiflorum TaxID=4521 RepID=A0AAD8T8J5_LOLMU|nr:hypothetical protein QYE76_037899 [Lolium multiflorum]
MLELPMEDSALDLESSKPTQSPPEQETTVEDQCRSAWVSQVLEKQRCHFLYFLAHTAGTALPQEEAGPMQDEAAGTDDAPEQQEAAGASSASDQQEDAGDVEESILGNLSPTSDDASSMNTEEFNKALKELEGEEEAEAESAPPKQVLATITGLGEDANEEETPTGVALPRASTSDTPPSRPRRRATSESGKDNISGDKDYLTPEELVEQAGIGALIHTEVLNKPITPEEAADPVALEAARKEMLATAKRISTTAAAMLEERQEAQEVMDGFLQREREAVDSLQKAKKLREHWESMMKDAHKEADKIRRDAISPRKITFATPSNQQPLTTPKENMQKAAVILNKKNEEIDINHLRTLVASAVRQQSKADTSCKLESNPDFCISTAQKDASRSKHRDDESRIGSSERRRKTREHPNPIPIPSKTPPSDPKKGKDAMYTGSDKYRNPSPPPNGYPRPPHPRRRSPAGNARPHGPGGINIRDNVVPQRNRNMERTPEPRRSRNEERDPEPRRSRNDEGDHHHGEGPARIWLGDLEKNSIFCWFDLKNAFEKHFRGTYKRPATTSDLQACIQKKGETFRSFLTRWLQTTNECENVDNRTAMHAFIGGLQRGGLLWHKLTCLVNANKLTLDDMITIASDHTAADDDACGDLAATAIPLHQQKKNRDNGSSSDTKRKNPPDDQRSGGSDLVAMAFQRGGQGGGRGRGRGGGAGRGQQRGDEVTAAGTRAPQTYEEYRDMPCLAHIDPATGKSSHTNRNFKWVNDLKTNPEAGYKRARKHRPRGKGGKGKNKDKEEDSSEAMDEDDASLDAKEGSAANKSNPFVKKSAGAYHTFLGTPTVHASKSALRILNATVLCRKCYALVVSPRIDGYDFSKCLMDGGASLNIMYLETLERMNLTKEQLKHITTEFHGVVLGKKAKSLGSIRLLVAFGDVNNFREEMITFEVVPFKSSYHIIFGRPTYHKFHARAWYIYNKLKIPGPKGMITISGDYKKAHECELGAAEL